MCSFASLVQHTKSLEKKFFGVPEGKTHLSVRYVSDGGIDEVVFSHEPLRVP